MAAPPAGNLFSFALFLLISFTSSIVLLSIPSHAFPSLLYNRIVIIFPSLPLNSFLSAPSPPRFLVLLPFQFFALFSSPLIAIPCPSLLYPSTSLLLLFSCPSPSWLFSFCSTSPTLPFSLSLSLSLSGLGLGLGQRLEELVILDHDKANGRVALSTKTLEPTPGESSGQRCTKIVHHWCPRLYQIA